VFGIMDFVNLAHGLALHDGRLISRRPSSPGPEVSCLGAVLALAATLLLGIVLEFTAPAASLRARDHLDHVLADLRLDPVLQTRRVRLIWGPGPGWRCRLPPWLSVPVQIIPRHSLSGLSAGDHRGPRWRSRYCSISV